MAFARKSKKKIRPAKSSSRKNRADPIFSNTATFFSRKHRRFRHFRPYFLKPMRYKTNSTASP